MTRHTRPAFLLLLAGFLLASATPARVQQAPNPADRFEVSDVMIPARDGVKLHTRIFTPRNQAGPLPIILSRESGIHAFTMRDIDELGMAGVARRALEIVNDGTSGFHVSFDVDGCDPTVIPGSGTLVPGGVSFREAHLLMEYVADDGRLQSMEIVELNPFLDERNISAKRMLELILSAMGKSIL